MRARLALLLSWLRCGAEQNIAVQIDATRETLRRFRTIAAVVFLLNLGYASVFLFGGIAAQTPQLAQWINGIAWTHIVMALCMATLGPAIYLVSRQKAPSPALSLALQDIFTVVCLCFGIALSTIDQWATPSTTLFAMTSLISALMSLRRPRVTFPLYVLAYILYFWALGLTQHDASLLAIGRSHGFAATGISLVVSVLAWRQFFTATHLRWELADANARLAQKQEDLEFQATHDTLTGLCNRREFLRLTKAELVRARRYPADTSLIMVDLDHFKKINDSYGHPVGDEVLKQTAKLLSKRVRAQDLVARLGGEEFVILLRETPKNGALELAEALRTSLNKSPMTINDLELSISASFGISSLPKGHSGSVDELYSAADKALYLAKSAGRNRVV